ncbi:xanthine dehydrogenase family protein molybdopterin-binding subunit [Pseudonocardia endophytica]|uniref:Xanthine dehydrogenase molybdenum binding subunit apoprotein n=1 Tax=Pseudonocardia endophytica TaxID=401976 RepID=A0A4R1HV21_PSEEN|nr:xanthine dehydrogenase family protein molybdopterin-binding subunit [Pseudonocardia endophytica]TCK24520.1 xanthine dehydrogenase molybdenum binding subunit apoprotein [Pseudonocardia endophytica]
MTVVEPRAMGTDLHRIEGPAKVTGTARYSYEQHTDAPLYLIGVPATIARGTVTDVDTVAAEAVPGVVGVLTADSAPRLADTSDPELAVLQSREIRYRGQYVAAVIAESQEAAREAADLVAVSYDEQPATTAFDERSPETYAPARVLFFPTDTVTGDPDAALAAADVSVRATYRTPAQHHNPMEPHATVACWAGDEVTVFESTQSVAASQEAIAGLFGLEPGAVAVLSPHVGGGFGSKGTRHPGAVLAVMAARTVPGRAVKLALSRREMFETTGYRPATVQHMALGASADGRIEALVHDAVEPTARTREFTEPAAVVSRHLYTAANRRTTHRLVPMDVSGPTFMRAPGEAPGSFAAECAMDELAVALGMDPIELRVRNEPETDPEHGLPFSSRNLVACLRRGAERFGWADRDPTPRARLVDGWWRGTGVAASFFPTFRMPGSTAVVRFRADGGRYEVLIGAADIGQGARTVLTQIAADALGVPASRVDVAIGDTALPHATIAGGSTGTSSWGTAVVDAAERFRDKYGEDPDDGDEADGMAPDNPWAAERAMGAYGAQFAEVAVHADTGEVRVPRMLGVFAAGRIINPQTARSQFLGGMVWGLSMALHEESVLDPRTGHWVNHDLAGYHVAVHADVGEMDAEWVDEDDPYVNPMGAKGIGEIGIVGAAAAIANAAHHATGVRVRSLPITLDAFLT